MSLEDKFQQMIQDLHPEINAIHIPDTFKQNRLYYKRMVKSKSYYNKHRHSHNPVFLQKSLRVILNKMRFDRHSCGGALFVFDDRIRTFYQNTAYPFKRCQKHKIDSSKNKTKRHKSKQKKGRSKLTNVSINSDIKTKSSSLMGSYYNGKRRKSRRLITNLSVLRSARTLVKKNKVTN